jgi:hypothetical protein
VEDTVKAYRIHEKRRHLLELKKELTLAEEQLDGVHQRWTTGEGGGNGFGVIRDTSRLFSMRGPMICAL